MTVNRMSKSSMAAPIRYRNASTGVVFPPTVSGGNLSEDSTYYYRTFTSSGTLSVSGPLTASFLVVAGGGGGGTSDGGGGGAGGYRALSSQNLSAGNYAVTVGAGGSGWVYASSYPTSGNTSSFNGISSTGGGTGGGGGGGLGRSGTAGGSGGGGNYNNTSWRAGGSGNAGGYDPAEGNSGATATTYKGGGGGGATGAGSNNGTGGSGAQWLDGSYYAGGGGGSNGGAGGLGGGGNGVSTGGVAGIANTGGGGGGGGNNTGGAGGSGIVIVRYAKDAITASTDTFELIGTLDLLSPQSALTFTGIPQQYKHLQIRMITQVTGSAGNDLKLRFNGDSTTGNYKDHGLYGFAGASSTGSAYSGPVFTDSIYCGSTYPTSETNLFGGAVLDILDFANTSKNKTVRGISGKPRATDGVVYFQSGVWFNTAAITSFTIVSASGTTFAPYTRVSLYGLRA